MTDGRQPDSGNKMVRKNQSAAKKPKGTVTVQQYSSEAPDAASARVLLQPEIQAAVTIHQWQGNIVDVDEIAKQLQQQTERMVSGKMARAEIMLLSQAHTLDELFNNLARKARNQEYLKNYETFLRLALKAQSQCRQTLETLSNIKNPPVVYAKQANISNGPQQVNNGIPAQATHAEEIKNQPNELLEVIDGARVDTRATKEAIGSDTAMAALE
jgi:hypothetical protein